MSRARHCRANTEAEAPHAVLASTQKSPRSRSASISASSLLFRGRLGVASQVAGVGVALVLSVGCEASQPGAEPTSAGSTAASSVAPSQSQGTCTNPEGGACLNQLEPRRSYTTQDFDPQLTYSVPNPNWFNFEDLSGNFLLVPPGNDLEGVNAATSDFIGVYTSIAPSRIVKAEGCVTEPVKGAGDSPAAMAAWFRTQGNLIATRPHPMRVGGLRGVALDLRYRPGTELAHCRDGGQVLEFAGLFSGRTPSSLDHAVVPGMTMRLLLLGYDDAVLGVELDDIDKAPGGLTELNQVARHFVFRL